MFYSSTPGLYIHIPFCHSRCGYCAFVSSVYDPDDPSVADSYLTALESEWARKRTLLTNSPGTVYIGGGTPSALSGQQLERLLELLPAAQDETAREVTCEVNPESASPDKLALLRDHGVNRLSVGVQTFSPTGLRILDRRHRAGDAQKTVCAAQRLGFKAISVDLIHGIPGQTLDDVREDIKKSVDLGIQHISNYALTLDERAAGYSKLKSILTKNPENIGKAENAEESSAIDAIDAIDAADAAERALWDATEAVLTDYGFRHYETSNFAREGFICRHNAAIWQGGEYLGLGAGAHSHWAGRRFANTGSIANYIRRGGVGTEAFCEELCPLAKARETAVFWLRLFDGIDLADYRERTGYDLRTVYPTLPDGVEINSSRAWVPAHLQPVLDGILVEMV